MRAIPLLLFITFAIRAAQPYSGLSPEDAVKAMKLPEGFHVQLVAAEPDVTQPVAFEFDDRGRIWVAEFLSYPKWAPEGRDRIVLLEDTNGDGRVDKRTVVWDKANYVTGLTLGYGGIWVISAPNLWFIPCDFNADVPKITSEPQIILDGWSHAGVHNIVSNLTWGPDGWLYGCNGITSRSNVGPPGTPESARVYIDGGVWRFHPVTKKLEQICTGTTNPWGLDWDERGEMFITNNVTAHIFHVVPGARFERSHESDQNPYTYELMGGIGDHKHYDGAGVQDIKKPGRHSDFGGGHSHVGALIYKGRDWPEKYRNTIFMCNTHGNRINADKLELTPNGYVAHHSEDFMLANDTSFRGVTLKMGPEGAMYVSDWHQDGECHKGDEVGSGRIYRIHYHAVHAKKLVPEFAKEKNWDALSKIMNSERDQWSSQHASRILEENQIVDHGFESDYWSRQDVLSTTSPLVRLHLYSEARMAKAAPDVVKKTLREFAASPADADNRNYRLMLWYAIEPLVEDDPSCAFSIFRETKIRALRPFIARRMSEHKLPLAIDELSKTPDETLQLDLLHGIAAALKGRFKVDAPPHWKEWFDKASAGNNAEIKSLAQQIAAVFGDSVTFDALRKIAEDKKATVLQRKNALQSLIDARDDKLVPLLQKLLKDLDIRRETLRALARFDDPQTAPLILQLYPKFVLEERADALATLAARPESAQALLSALKTKVVPSTDLNAETIRALEAHGIAELDAWIKAHWGLSRKTAEDKLHEITRLKKLAAEPALKAADLLRGKEIFKKSCANCHTLFGEGGKVGPDLTGSGRKNLDYLLVNIVDPNAIVPQEYLAWTVKTRDGRVLSGLLRNERAESLEVITATETISLRTEDVQLKRRSELSMMPENILNTLKDSEILDLILYLQK